VGVGRQELRATQVVLGENCIVLFVLLLLGSAVWVSQASHAQVLRNIM
jgi:hypothetical protein